MVTVLLHTHISLLLQGKSPFGTTFIDGASLSLASSLAPKNCTLHFSNTRGNMAGSKAAPSGPALDTCTSTGVLELLLNPVWHRIGYFTLLNLLDQILSADFFFKNFQTFLEVKIEINQVIFDTLSSSLSQYESCLLVYQEAIALSKDELFCCFVIPCQTGLNQPVPGPSETGGKRDDPPLIFCLKYK